MSLQPLLTQMYKLYMSASPCLLFCLLHCWRLLAFHRRRLSSLQLAYFPSRVTQANCLAACLLPRSEQSWPLPGAGTPGTRSAPRELRVRTWAGLPSAAGSQTGFCLNEYWRVRLSFRATNNSLKYWECAEDGNLLYYNFRKR